jgi:hypothetical protein
MNRRFGIRTIHPLVDLMPLETFWQRMERLAGLAARSFLIDVGIFQAVYTVVLAEIVYILIVGLNGVDSVQPSTTLTLGEKTILILLILMFMVVLLKYIMETLDSVIRWITLGVFRDE